MKKLIILLLFISTALYGQLDTIDLKTSYFGIPSTEGEADFVLNEAYKMNQGIRELDTLLSPIHLFMYFGDSTISLSYTTSWAHLTNTGDSLFIQLELDGFTVSGDTLTSIYGGDFTLFGTFTHDAGNGNTVSIRYFNVTKTAGIPVAGANTGRGANNFMSTQVMSYGDVDIGDEIVVQYKGDTNGTAVFKNGSILIQRLHD